MELKFYYCKHCGKIIAIVKDTSAQTICCGEIMSELPPNFIDASTEKHVPVITTDKNCVTVSVGSIIHPSLTEHHIEWILLQTDKGIQCKQLNPLSTPKTDFLILQNEKVLAAYEYCNLHKLWKKEI